MKNILVVILFLVVVVVLFRDQIQLKMQPAIEAKGTAVETEIKGISIK